MWSWSYSTDGHQAIYNAIQEYPHEDLAIALAEFDASSPDDTDAFNEPLYWERKANYDKLPSDILADAVWERASELAECSDGGWYAYICPFQCHGVSLD